MQFGPPFGYFPNAKKIGLVVKEQFLDHAHHLFSDTCVNVIADGRPYLGRLLVQIALRIMFPVKLLLGLLNWSFLPPFLLHSLMLLFQFFTWCG